MIEVRTFLSSSSKIRLTLLLRVFCSVLRSFYHVKFRISTLFDFLIDLYVRLMSDCRQIKELLWIGTHRQVFVDFLEENYFLLFDCNRWTVFSYCLKVELSSRTLVIFKFIKSLYFLIFYHFQFPLSVTLTFQRNWIMETAKVRYNPTRSYSS